VPDSVSKAREEYLAAILEPDPAAARAVVRGAVRAGLGVETLFEEVLTPAMIEVGRLWEGGEINVAHEHLATEVTSSLVTELAARLEPAEATGRLAVVSCSPEEQHCLGGQMLSGLLEAAGWEVLFLGTTLPLRDLVEIAEEEAADVIALSTAMPHNLPAVEEVVRAVQELEEPPLVLVGGRAYNGEDDARRVGADAWAARAAEAPALLTRKLPPAA
jgi:MerR family transcriptional regulator, light-induced transcriptional regulator